MMQSHNQCHVIKHSCPYNMSSCSSENVLNMNEARCRSHPIKRNTTLLKNKEITHAARCKQFQGKKLTTVVIGRIHSVSCFDLSRVFLQVATTPPLRHRKNICFGLTMWFFSVPPRPPYVIENNMFRLV